MDALLAVGGAVAAREVVEPPDPIRVVPPNALVIGVSSLATHLIVDTLREMKAKGRNVVCLVTDLTDLMPPPRNEAEALARRLWSTGIDNRIRLLQEIGIPVRRWPNGSPLGPVVRHLRQDQLRQPAGIRR